MLKQLNIKNFKQFEDYTIDLDNFNVLVGKNNSGKSSILQSIILGYYLIKKCIYIRHEAVLIRAVSDHNFLAIPCNEKKDLWLNSQYRSSKNKQKPITIRLIFDNDIFIEFHINFFYGALHYQIKDTNIYYNLEFAKYLLDDKSNIPLIISSSTGIVNQEEYKSLGLRNYLASIGKTSEILRSYLYDLFREEINEGSDNKIIIDTLKKLFSVEQIKSEWKKDYDPYISVKYKENKKNVNNYLDLISGGSGFIQIIQILTRIWSSGSNLFLLDEPDAHLHSNLIADMVSILKSYSLDYNKQIVIASHSKDIIDNVDFEAIKIIDSTQIYPLTCSKDKKNALETLGISSYDYTRIEIAKKIILVEGKSDKSMFLKIGTFIEPEFKNAINGKSCLFYIQGKGNLDSYLNLINAIQHDSKTKLKIFYLQDRDTFLDQEVDDLKEKFKQKIDEIHIFRRNELESYLIEFKIFQNALTTKKINITEKDFGLIKENVINNRNEKFLITSTCRNEYCNRNNLRLTKPEDTSNVDILYDDLYTNDPLSIFPGKRLLNLLLEAVNTKYHTNINKLDLLNTSLSNNLSVELIEIVKSIYNFALQ